MNTLHYGGSMSEMWVRGRERNRLYSCRKFNCWQRLLATGVQHKYTISCAIWIDDFALAPSNVHIQPHKSNAMNHSSIVSTLCQPAKRIKCHFTMKAHLLTKNMTCAGRCLPCMLNLMEYRVDKRVMSAERQKMYENYTPHTLIRRCVTTSRMNCNVQTWKTINKLS